MEELEEEVLAVESIYGDQFQKLAPDTISIRFPLDPTAIGEEDPDNTILMTLQFPSNYPHEIPTLSLAQDAQEADKLKLDRLTAQLEAIALESVDTPMIFTLATTVTDFIQSRAADAHVQEQNTAADAALEEKKWIGTRVTVETFAAWKKQFDLKFNTEVVVNVNKPTGNESASYKQFEIGRELFEKDLGLGQSDANYLEDGDEDIEYNVQENEQDAEIDVEIDMEMFRREARLLQLENN